MVSGVELFTGVFSDSDDTGVLVEVGAGVTIAIGESVGLRMRL